MRISRIYIEQPIESGKRITLEGQPAHYLNKVLRLSLGSQIILFNGDGSEYSATIIDQSKKNLQVEILQQHTPAVESPLHIILGLGVSRGDRMDYAVQKSTELGVNEIVPLFTEHGEVKLKGERLEKRRNHWQQVAISACEQSGRVKIPTVHTPIDLEAWLGQADDYPTKLLFDHTRAQTLSKDKPEGPIAVLIGPEGGFSTKELNQAQAQEFIGIALGPRVLRTETAPVSVLSILQYVWGDF